MLGVCKKKLVPVFSSNGVVFSICWFAWSLSFAWYVTQLCSPSNLCVWGVDTCCVDTQSSLSVFTMLGTAFLSSLHSGVVVVS